MHLYSSVYRSRVFRSSFSASVYLHTKKLITFLAIKLEGWKKFHCKAQDYKFTFYILDAIIMCIFDHASVKIEGVYFLVTRYSMRRKPDFSALLPRITGILCGTGITAVN